MYYNNITKTDDQKMYSESKNSLIELVHLESINKPKKLSRYKKILDFFFPNIDKVVRNGKVQYYYEKTWSLFKDMQISKKVNSLSRNKRKKIYKYKLSDHSQNLLIFSNRSLTCSNYSGDHGRNIYTEIEQIKPNSATEGK